MKTFKFNGREHKVFRISAFGSEHEVILTKEEYYNPKTLAVQAYEVYENGEAEPFGMLTANMAPSDDAYLQDDTHAYLKTWSENSGWAERLVKDYHLAEPTGNMAFSGFVCAPLYKWNLEVFCI